MKNLLKLEFRRILRQKSLYICTGIMLALLFLSALVLQLVNQIDPYFGAMMGASTVDFLLTGVNNSSFTVLIGIIIALNVCEDYDQQTARIILARGYSKLQLYFAKMICVVIWSIAVYIITQLFAFVMGAAFFDMGNTAEGRYLVVQAAQVAACLAHIMLFFCICAMIRRVGASIAIVIAGPIVLDLILGLANMALQQHDIAISEYWISSFLTDLFYVGVADDRMLLCVLGSVGYSVAFGLLGMLCAKKTEIK